MKIRPTTWPCLALVFLWSWSFWILAALSGTSVKTTPGQTLLFLGLAGPMLGGIGFTYFARDCEEWRDYWLRIVDVKRIPARWYLIVLLLPPVLLAVAALLDVASGGVAPVQIGKTMAAFLAAPLNTIPFLLRIFFQGPFPEELGWRGYILDQFQARWNALVSSLVLGAIWALWHLPLFFIKDMLHSGRDALWLWLFMAQTIAVAVIFTWIFNSTRRSTLAAIIFHFMVNLVYELAKPTARTNSFATLLWIMAAIAVVGFKGPKTLGRQSSA